MTGRATTSWGALASPDLPGRLAAVDGLALLPVGAIEQHGAHLPLDTDSRCVTAIAEAASQRCGVPVLPCIAVGCSLGHSDRWPGTLALRPHTLSTLVQEYARWIAASGCTRLLLLNGHYTNWAPLRCALEEIRCDLPALRIGIRSLWELSPALHERYHADGANWHANEAETSLMLHLHPELVHTERIVDEADHAADHVFNYTVDRESRSGVVGRPSAATAAAGARLHHDLVEALVALCQRARRETDPLTTSTTEDR